MFRSRPRPRQGGVRTQMCPRWLRDHAHDTACMDRSSPGREPTVDGNQYSWCRSGSAAVSLRPVLFPASLRSGVGHGALPSSLSFGISGDSHAGCRRGLRGGCGRGDATQPAAAPACRGPCVPMPCIASASPVMSTAHRWSEVTCVWRAVRRNVSGFIAHCSLSPQISRRSGDAPG